MNNSNTGQIVKSRREVNFVQIPNELLSDPTLSFKAKGLLCLLLSFPDNWVVYKNNLVRYSSDGKTSIDSAWKELCAAGYILSVRIIENNLTKGWNHIVYDKPQLEKTQQNQGVHRKPDFRTYENRISEDRISENPPLIINSEQTHSPNNKKERERTLDFSSFWAVYDNKEGREDARVEWNKLSNREKEDAVDYAQWWQEEFLDKYNGVGNLPMAKNYLRGKRWEDEY